MKIKYYVVMMGIVLGMMGCGNPDENSFDVIGIIAGQSPNVDKRFPENMAYNEKNGYSTIYAQEETYNVYVCADTHVTTDNSNWKRFISDYRKDVTCPLAIHLGDLIDAQNHFAFMKGALTEIPKNPLKEDTLMAVIGNHDIYFNQWKEFQKYWFTSSYYFEVITPSGKRDLYIILDSANGTVGAKQLAWLKQLLNNTDTIPYRNKIVCTHTMLIMDDTSQGITSNFAIEETYAIIGLLSQHGIDMYWSGHDHARDIRQVKSFTSVVLDAMNVGDETPSYVVATMGEEVSLKFIEL